MQKNKLIYIIVICLLFILGTGFSIRDILWSDISPSVFSQKALTLQVEPSNSHLIQGQKISGSFTTHYNYFGIIELNLEPQRYRSSDTLQLRIREQSQSDWIYEGNYDTGWITTYTKYQFGLPTITTSKNKTYYFEIESLRGKNNEAISFNLSKQDFTLKYQYPVQNWRSNPTILQEFLIGKTITYLQNNTHLLSLIGNFLPLFIFLNINRLIVFFKRLYKLAENPFNKCVINQEIRFIQLFAVITVNSLAGIIIYWPFITFQKVFIQLIHDFYSNLWPNYIHITDLITNFEFPAWSFSVGLGTNIFAGNFIRVSIVDPFTWPMYFLNEFQILLAVPYILILKIITAGSIFYLYLRFNKISHISALVFSVSYSISGQMIVRSPWYHYTTEMVFLPFLLISLDKFINKKKRIWPSIICFAWLGSYHLYHVFLYGVFSYYYVGWKYWYLNTLHFSAWKKNLVAIVRLYAQFTYTIVTGLLLSAIILLPNIYNYLHSSRITTFQNINIENHYSIDSLFVNTHLFLLIIIRFFGNSITGYLGSYSGWLNSLEDPILFSGILSLVFFFTFPFYFKKKRLFFLGTIIVITSYLFIPHIRNIWNIFYGNRFKTSTFFILPIMLLLASASFDVFIKNNKPDFILKRTTIVITSIFIISSLIILDPNIQEITINFESFIFKMLIFVTLIFIAIKNIPNRIIVLITVSLFSMIYLNAKYIHSGQWLEFNYAKKQSQNSEHTKNALQYIKEIDNGFYRINKDFSFYDAIGINDPVAFNYAGISTYQSFNEALLTKFTTFWDADNKYELGSRVFNEFSEDKSYLNNLVTLKYHLSIDKEKPKGNFKKINTISGIDIYKNPDVIPFGAVFFNIISEDVLKTFKQDQYQNIISKAVLIQDNMDKDLTGISVIKPEQDINKIESTKIQLNITEFNNTYISGNVSLNNTGIMLFQFPYNEGWHLQINNIPAKLIEVNAGLTGAILPEGTHKIQLKYTQPFLKEGITVSLITLIAFLIFNKKSKIKGIINYVQKRCSY